MAIKLGRGFGMKGDKVYSYRHKLGDASAVIRKRKASKKPRPVSRSKALSTRPQKP